MKIFQVSNHKGDGFFKIQADRRGEQWVLCEFIWGENKYTFWIDFLHGEYGENIELYNSPSGDTFEDLPVEVIYPYFDYEQLKDDIVDWATQDHGQAILDEKFNDEMNLKNFWETR